MSTVIGGVHEAIILDACCIITLYQTQRMEDILRTLPKPLMVAEYVQVQEILQFSLQALIGAGLLTITAPESEAEENTFVNLAYYLDDGEAMTGSLAIHRNWAIATDDRKAIALFQRLVPHVQLVSTLEIIRYWAEATIAKHEEIRTALQNMRMGTPYAPKANHPFYLWWQKYIG